MKDNGENRCMRQGQTLPKHPNGNMPASKGVNTRGNLRKHTNGSCGGNVKMKGKDILLVNVMHHQ